MWTPAGRKWTPPGSTNKTMRDRPPWGACLSSLKPPLGKALWSVGSCAPRGGSVSRIEGRSGPPLASLPLFSWEGAAQLETPRPVRRAVWDGLARS